MADNLKGIPFSSPNEGIDYPMQAKLAVLHNHNVFGIGTPRGESINPLTLDEVYVVWFAFVRGNWKAILSTSRPDGRIYEVSYKAEHDGSDGPESLVVDVYIKTHNTPIDPRELGCKMTPEEKDSVRRSERERIIKTLRAAQQKRWLEHLNKHPLATPQSCSNCYAVYDTYASAIRIATSEENVL
jgi:hypothetical protein